jgi:hypothetical protein
MDIVAINKFVIDNLPYVLLIISSIMLILMIITMSLMIRLSKMKRKYRKMMCGVDVQNLEELVVRCVGDVQLNDKKVEDLSMQYQRLTAICSASIQKIGIVRFNAFKDTGSDLSFAIALLNGKDNGAVISSIYGRTESRIYAKPIIAGQSSYYLTTEEKSAINYAQDSKSKEK